MFVECRGVEPHMAIQRMANLPLLRSFPPSSEAAPADYPVRRLTIQCSLWGFHLLSFNLLTLGYLIRIAKFAEQQQYWFSYTHDPFTPATLFTIWGWNNLVNTTRGQITESFTTSSTSSHLHITFSTLSSPFTHSRFLPVALSYLQQTERITFASKPTVLTPKFIVDPPTVFLSDLVHFFPVVTIL